MHPRLQERRSPVSAVFLNVFKNPAGSPAQPFHFALLFTYIVNIQLGHNHVWVKRHRFRVELSPLNLAWKKRQTSTRVVPTLAEAPSPYGP